MGDRHVITVWDSKYVVIDRFNHPHGDDIRDVIRNYANYLTSPSVHAATLESINDDGALLTLGSFDREGITA